MLIISKASLYFQWYRIHILLRIPRYVWFPIIFLCLFFILTDVEGQELKKYACSADHYEIKTWLKEFERSFDSSGIILQKKEYHPLTIANFGILSYHHFLDTGDSTSYRHAINQYKYFKDSSRITYTDDKSAMGLPYRFAFHDLKAPWYSGMTQGFAISYLLRYYLLTRNQEALLKVRQLANFMLRPEEKGGTIGKTPEGFTFIEEYPNSKSYPQVLNGFMNGLIGLREYLEFFPEDTMAQRIHKECYDAMISTFREYDLPDWTTYDRSKKKINNAYFRYQITQLEHLNLIYDDYRLTKQMMLWSYLSSDRPDSQSGSLTHKNFRYAVPFEQENGRYHTENFNFDRTLVSDTTYLLWQKSKIWEKPVRHNKKYSLQLTDSVYSVLLAFDRNIENAYWEFFSSGNDTGGKITYHPQSNLLNIIFPSKTDRFEFQYKNKKEKKISLTQLQRHQGYQFEIPRFLFHNFLRPWQLKADSTYLIDISGHYLNDAEIFYRYAETLDKLRNSKYEIGNTIKMNNPIFTPCETAYYQFFLVSPPIKGLWFEKPQIRPLKLPSIP